MARMFPFLVAVKTLFAVSIFIATLEVTFEWVDSFDLWNVTKVMDPQSVVVGESSFAGRTLNWEIFLVIVSIFMNPERREIAESQIALIEITLILHCFWVVGEGVAL
jgi:hypothetical protein